MGRRSEPSFWENARSWTLREIGARLAELAWNLAAPAAATLMAWWAHYGESYPLFYVALIFVFVFGLTALALNQLQAFVSARAVAGKVAQPTITIELAEEHASKEQGYVFQFLFLNLAVASLEYSVTRAEAFLEEKAARQEAGAIMGSILPPGLPGFFRTGIVALGAQKNTTMKGKAKIRYRYGRPGKLTYSDEISVDVLARTNDDGVVIGVNASIRTYVASAPSRAWP